MVKIISSSSLGYGDYGARFSDVEVDGVAFNQKEIETAKKETKQPESPKPTKLTGGRKLK